MSEEVMQSTPLQGRKLLGLIPLPVLNKQPAAAQSEEVSIQVFDSVGWVDRRLLWIFEIVSSLAVVLLAAGLVTSQTNVQTHGAILTDNAWMQLAWAWTQNIAIDMSLLGAIIRSAVYWLEREYKKAVLYSALAGLLLFTAFIVSDVEAMYQSVQGITIDAAWGKIPLVSIELLTSIRSFAVVLLLVAHATQYVGWYHVKYQQRKNATQTLSKQDETPLQGNEQPHQGDAQSDIEKLIQAMQEAQNKQLQVVVEQVTRVTVEAVQKSLQQALPEVSAPLQIAAPSSHENATQADVPPFEREYGPEIGALYLKNPAITPEEVKAQIGCSLPTAKTHVARVAEHVDKLQMTMEVLTKQPDMTDEELAEHLSLKRPASARFWRLKAVEMQSQSAS
jgi:hypothetical protein